MQRQDRFSRRGLLAAGSAWTLTGLCPARAQDAGREEPRLAAAREMLRGQLTIDMHSHAGRYRRLRGAFEPVALPMRSGGLAVACLAMVADEPATQVTPDNRIVPVREPRAGEMWAHGLAVFGRMLALAEEAKLAVISDQASLAAARERPSVLIAAEGADFLEGALQRLDEVRARFPLRHLQLTHFRVNELGDNQTEPAVHGGLTRFGADVVRACNAKGIIVDVAHSSFDAVRQIVSVTAKPVVLSHTSLNARPGARSRQISRDHARAVAGTGGVIGIWPPRSIFKDMPSFAGGFARMVEAVGIDHVGLGTDFLGIPGGSVFPGYAALPELAAELRLLGFSPPEILKLLGGNYARVFAATVV